MTRHLLLTAWAFPPARTSGVHRAAGLAKAFRAAGWDVTVLTAPQAVFESQAMTDTTVGGGDGVHVREVPFSSPAYAIDVTRWPWLRARHPELWNVVRAWQERRAFPEPGFGLWRHELERAADAVHQAHPVDLAIGTANPHVDFAPGAHLAQKYGVPAVMDFRDAWTVDVFTGTDRRNATSAERAMERRLLARATEIWFVNEPIRRWHAERHPELAGRMRVVPNGFDLVGGVSPAVQFRPPVPGEGLTFGYVGTINYGQFPAEELFAGWRLARSRDPLLARSRLVLRGHLGRTGVAGAELQRLLDEASTDSVSYEGPVAKADLADAYAEFDALVLALASGPGVTSGKVFEFAATGLPIASVHDPASAASAILADSPVWTASASLAPTDIADALVRTAQAVLEQTPDSRRTAVSWGAKWERGRQLSDAVRELGEIIDERIT